MVVRTAEARWLGDVKTGVGKIKLGSESDDGAYSPDLRFKGAPGSNEEEIVGASQASCFNMALAKSLEKEGFAVQAIDTVASVSIDTIGQRNRISSIQLDTEVMVVPHIDDVILREQAELANHHCPASGAITGIEVSVRSRRMLMSA